MRISILFRGLLCVVAMAVATAPSAHAQLCPDPGDTLWKVDTLPDVPGPTDGQVIVAVCEDDAFGSYFQLGGAGPQYIKQASIMLGHTGGQPDHQFILNIEVYEGDVLFDPGFGVTMPPKIFDLQADEGTTVIGTSTGMNTFDLTPYNIVVEDNFVVAFRMLSNVSFPGCAPAVPGVPANVMTDGTGLCSPGKSLLDERDFGWVDPADWAFAFGQFICPQFYNGNWVVRACTTDAGSWMDLGGGTVGINGLVKLEGSGPLTPGSFNPITLSDAAPNAVCLVWIALDPTPFPAVGGTVHAFPKITQLFFNTNGAGFFSAAAAWPDDIPPGTDVYFQFIVQDFSSIHNITLSNGVKGTTP